MTFRVGQKVVCVEAGWPNLTEGKVYTISNICPVCSGYEPSCNEGFSFIDQLGAPHKDGTRCNAWPTRIFRPIVERKTDISVFTEILRKATKPAPAVSMSLQP